MGRHPPCPLPGNRRLPSPECGTTLERRIDVSTVQTWEAAVSKTAGSDRNARQGVRVWLLRGLTVGAAALGLSGCMVREHHPSYPAGTYQGGPEYSAEVY